MIGWFRINCKNQNHEIRRKNTLFCVFSSSRGHRSKIQGDIFRCYTWGAERHENINFNINHLSFKPFTEAFYLWALMWKIKREKVSFSVFISKKNPLTLTKYFLSDSQLKVLSLFLWVSAAMWLVGVNHVTSLPPSGSEEAVRQSLEGLWDQAVRAESEVHTETVTQQSINPQTDNL